MGSRKVYYLTDHNNHDITQNYGHAVFYFSNQSPEWRLEYYFTFSIASKSIQINEYSTESDWTAIQLTHFFIQKCGRDIVCCEPVASLDYTIECLIDQKRFLLGRIDLPQKSVLPLQSCDFENSSKDVNFQDHFTSFNSNQSVQNNYRNNDNIISQSGTSTWDILVNRYGLTKPFSKEYDAISLTPSEIHRFTDTDRSLEDNSFLLHGYYQYKHILLLRTNSSKQDTSYFIGVPGIWQKQEKIVAGMFGFSSFKSMHFSAEKKVIHQTVPPSGTFGYYLREIQFVATI